jgi:hypothetical protein
LQRVREGAGFANKKFVIYVDFSKKRFTGIFLDMSPSFPEEVVCS